MIKMLVKTNKKIYKRNIKNLNLFKDKNLNEFISGDYNLYHGLNQNIRDISLNNSLNFNEADQVVFYSNKDLYEMNKKQIQNYINQIKNDFIKFYKSYFDNKSISNLIKEVETHKNKCEYMNFSDQAEMDNQTIIYLNKILTNCLFNKNPFKSFLSD